MQELFRFMLSKFLECDWVKHKQTELADGNEHLWPEPLDVNEPVLERGKADYLLHIRRKVPSFNDVQLLLHLKDIVSNFHSGALKDLDWLREVEMFEIGHILRVKNIEFVALWTYLLEEGEVF